MPVPTDALAVDSKVHRVPAPWGTVETDGLGWLGRERSNSHGWSSRVGSAKPAYLYHLPTHGRAGPDQVGSPLENQVIPEPQSPVYRNCSPTPPHPLLLGSIKDSEN